jgi:hypothetical protein
MHVDLALFEGDVLLGRHDFHVGATRTVSGFPLFQVTHGLGQDAADIVLSDFPAHVDLKTINLDMPIHESADWESIDLGRYTLVFWCRLDASQFMQAGTVPRRRVVQASLRWGSLALAVAPTLMVLAMLARVWAFGDRATPDHPIWPVFFLQLGAIATFCWHALGNRHLENGGAAGWMLRFVVLIPFGMIEYWCKYLWPPAR